jgi:hypothetical protein
MYMSQFNQPYHLNLIDQSGGAEKNNEIHEVTLHIDSTVLEDAFLC